MAIHPPHEKEKFRIAIIGSGPIGKLLACSAAQHPRIQLVQYEQDTLPLRPSFGYGVGPQTMIAVNVLNPELGRKLEEHCFVDQIWMKFWHGGDEDCLTAITKAPGDKVYRRVGRQELLNVLDESLPTGMSPNDIQYGKRLVDVKKVTDESLEITFQDGTKDQVNAIWACDGINSFCRRLVQGDSYRPATYTGHQVYRGKVSAKKVAEKLGAEFANQSYMFLGVEGWHILVFPIDQGTFTNIAAFCTVPEQHTFGRMEKVTLEEILGHFPGRNDKVDFLLKLVYTDTMGGCQRLQITHMDILGPLVNDELNIMTFGDAANAMTPHIAGSMSCGFIGCCTFLHEEWNPLISSEKLPTEASNAEITAALIAAARAYELKHLPLAQKLVDYSLEQGRLWDAGTTDVDELCKRPRFLWNAADDKLAYAQWT